LFLERVKENHKTGIKSQREHWEKVFLGFNSENAKFWGGRKKIKWRKGRNGAETRKSMMLDTFPGEAGR